MGKIREINDAVKNVIKYGLVFIVLWSLATGILRTMEVNIEAFMVALSGLTFFVVGALAFVYRALPIIMLPRTGVSTPGVVDELKEAESGFKYIVLYSFKLPNGEVIPVDTTVSRSSFASLVQGQAVRVLYNQNNPEISRLADYQLGWREKSAIIFLPLFSVVGIVVLILYFFV